MEKDFIEWHKKKHYLHRDRPRVFFKEREIWFCHLGENIGYEQDGRGEEFIRPIIILKKFNNEIAWAVPLTKVKKKSRPYYFSFSFRRKVQSTAVLSQLRLIDAKRLKYKAGYISESKFTELKTKIKQLLA